jgi:hypothetical protein
MGHLLDRCDILDILEEAAMTGRPVSVELRSNRKFVDHVREVVTRDGEDWALFKAHEPVAISDIHGCDRAEPREPTYSGREEDHG